MDVYWGDAAAALKAPFGAWTTYQYAQVGDKESFSRVIFRMMGLPEVRGPLDSQLTMHQLLRLVFVDQKSPQDTIFRTELFDSPVKREAVGEFALGTLDARIYEKQEALRVLQARLAEVRAQLHSLRAALREAGQDWSEGDIARAEAALANRKARIDTQIASLQAGRLGAARTERAARSAVERAAQKLQDAKLATKTTQNAITDTKLEIADSDLFLASLKHRADSVSDATKTHAALGAISFVYCPSCYAPVDASEEGACSLCKHKTVDGDQTFHVGKVRQELAQQIKESRSLQGMRRSRLRHLEAELQIQMQQQSSAQREYDSASTAITSSGEAALAALSVEFGQCDKEAESLVEKREMLKLLTRLGTEQGSITGQIKTTEDEIAFLRSTQNDRRAKAHGAIQRTGVSILQQDAQEETFRDAMELRFDFGADSIHLNGRRNFSDSSLVYLKNTFHLAVLLSSLELDFMRYPRLVIFDNIEDKGMVASRSQAFQTELARLSEAASVEHQIIYTTSMVSDEFRNSPRVVGPFYTKEHKTLQLKTMTSELPVTDTTPGVGYLGTQGSGPAPERGERQ